MKPQKKLVIIKVALWMESPDELTNPVITDVIANMDYKFISNSSLACISDSEIRETIEIMELK